MRVLLISTYELGRQPVHVASPAGSLRRAGHEVAALDLAVEAWDDAKVEWADAVAISVPMHTAMRLGAQVAERLAVQRPGTPIAFYGLYAPVSRSRTLGRLADRLLAGEFEPGLLAWVGELAAGRVPFGEGLVVHLGASDLAVPDRSVLPPLERYAHLEVLGERRLVGAVEASHGCSERCRHCPVPAVYDGRTRVVGVDLVMADIDQLVGLGARHVTFADPDFLSGPRHAFRVVDELARSFPGLTFDVTTKVAHVLRHADRWDAVAAAGCLFVVSAVETLDDRVLALLDKGHTAADAARAVSLLASRGIDAHPSFLPFTPWTTPGSVLDILDFVAAHGLVPVVDPVHYALRLLIPEGSLLLGVAELAPHLDAYDDDALTWRWRAGDPAVDELQIALSAVVEEGAVGGEPPGQVYPRVREVVAAAAGRPEHTDVPAGTDLDGAGRPRLSEPWFCCAEPTAPQFDALRI